jgi:hypothetical protein
MGNFNARIESDFENVPILFTLNELTIDLKGNHHPSSCVNTVIASWSPWVIESQRIDPMTQRLYGLFHFDRSKFARLETSATLDAFSMVNLKWDSLCFLCLFCAADPSDGRLTQPHSLHN